MSFFDFNTLILYDFILRMKELEKLGIKLIVHESMSKHTTWMVGGPADWYAEVTSAPQLVELLKITNQKKIPVFILGRGSNLLVSDQGIEGIVVRMCGDFESFAIQGTEVTAGAGVMLPTLAKKCAEQGLAGLEPLAGVPGTVGGAIMMNAGTRDLEIGKIVESVEAVRMDGTLEILKSSDIQFKYRSSSLEGKVVGFATFQLKPGNKEALIQRVEKFISDRLKTQPVGTMNAGSVFKNPEGHSAAELIEKAGLKGLKKGKAEVSSKHANFIMNPGGATAQEIKDLISEIQKIVKRKFNVDLVPEVKIVGRW